MTTKHSPFPWTRGGAYVVRDADGRMVARFERPEDAALVGSIPAMVEDKAALLESLRAVLQLARLKWGNLDPGANAVFEAAEAAIEKATGR